MSDAASPANSNRFKKGQRPVGRAKGTPNRTTIDVMRMAQQYGPDVIKEIARLALESKSEAIRVSAGQVILDRAYGRATQMHELPPGADAIFHVTMNLPRRDPRPRDADAEGFEYKDGTILPPITIEH